MFEWDFRGFFQEKSTLIVGEWVCFLGGPNLKGNSGELRGQPKIILSISFKSKNVGFPGPRFREGGSFFGKLICFIVPEMVSWLSKKSEAESGRPRNNLQVFCDQVSFPYSQKTSNRFPPCHVRPNPAKVRGNRGN